MTRNDLARIESTLGVTLPAAYSRFLLAYPPEFDPTPGSDDLLATADGIIEGTHALYALDRKHGGQLAPGCVAIDLGDSLFFQPDEGDRVFSYWPFEGEILEQAPDFATFLRERLAQELWSQLSDEIGGDDPPSLVRGYGFEQTFTYYDPRPYFDEKLTVAEADAVLARIGRVMALTESGDPRVHDTVWEGLDDEEGRELRAAALERYQAVLRRDKLLSAASEVFSRVLAFDDSHRPLNEPHARSRTLQFIRSRLDSSFVVAPPFEAWEIEELPLSD